MGVKGLWDLLSPSARRVNIDTLEGRILAVDASIWMVQFLKAMRDSEGNVANGAHLVGFFKRLCKLLYNRVRPVIVFDGPPPTLKRQTLAERRRLREEEGLGLKRTAEKLLVNFVRRKALQQKRRRDAGSSVETEDISPGAVVTLKDVLYGNLQEDEIIDLTEEERTPPTPPVVSSEAYTPTHPTHIPQNNL